MVVWDYISSTANAVNRNAVIPAWNLCSASYSYGRAATSKIGGLLQADNVSQFATGCAKNAAVFACREGLKTIPGGGPVYDIVSKSIPKNSKQGNSNKQAQEFKAVSSALEDHGKQIKEMNDLMEKMKEEINVLREVVNQVKVDEHYRDVEWESRVQESSKIQNATIKYLMTRTLQSNADKQPVNVVQNMIAMGFLSRYNLDNLDMPKKCPESS